MLRMYNLENGRMIVKSEAPATINVYVNPDEKERRFLVESLKIDEHTLQSALDPDEIARLEFEPDHIAVIFKRPRIATIDKDIESPEFGITSVGVFLFEDRMLVVLPEDLPIYDGNRPAVRFQSCGSLLLRMLYRSIAHFLDHLKAINMMADAIEDKINESLENRYLLNMFSLEKSLVYYQSAINTNDALLQKIRNNATKIGFSPEEIEILEDIRIENAQCAKQADVYSHILSGMMDARASIVSNNLNILMKTLNIITIGLMVPTMVVSIFSMNVKLPISDNSNWSFWVVLLLSSMALCAFMVYWKWKKW